MTPEDVLRNIAFPLLRFGTYTANAFLLGLPVVLLIVFRPVMGGLDRATWSAGFRKMGARIEGLVRAALIASALFTGLILLLQVALVSELSTGELTGSDMSSALDTAFGRWTLVRLPFLAALAILLLGKLRGWAFGGAVDDDGPSWMWWGMWLVLGAGLLLTSAASGHATVAEPRVLSVVNDLVHMVAGSVWFGGVVLLAVALPESWGARLELSEIEVLTPAVSRFADVALVAISVVAVTGVLQSLLHVGALSDLWTTTYGQALFFKIGLFLFVLALGAVNHFSVRKELQAALTAGEESGARLLFRKTIAVELALAVGIFAATGLLTFQARTKHTTAAPVASVWLSPGEK